MAKDKIRRDNQGRFLKGAPSPNNNGRPRKLREDPTLPAARRRAIFRVADREIEVKMPDGLQRITIFEANALQLGRAGANGDRAAAKTFINLTMQASEVNLLRRLATRQLMERLEVAEAENMELRSKLEPRHGVVVREMPEVTADFDEVYDDGRASLDGAGDSSPEEGD